MPRGVFRRVRHARLLALAAGSAAFIVGANGADAQESAAVRGTPRSVLAYAKAYRVSVDEAFRRLGLQRSVGELNAKLEQNEAGTFGGLYIEHTPIHRVVVKFTKNGAATLARYTQDPMFVLEVTPVSYKDLVNAQTDVGRLLKSLGIEGVSDVNVPESKLEFYVADPAASSSSARAFWRCRISSH